MRDSNGITLTGNTSTNNAGYGIRIRNSPDTVEVNNTVTGNAEGDIRWD